MSAFARNKTLLAKSKSPFSPQDREDVAWFVAQYRDGIKRLLPDAIPCKENMAVLGAELIRHIAEQQLSQQLDRPASIGRISLNPYTLNFEADRVHIGERGGKGDFVDIERLIVRTSWSSIFRLAPIVDEVHLDSPRFTIVRYDAQRFNFSDLIEKFSKQPSKPDSKPAQFSV